MELGLHSNGSAADFDGSCFATIKSDGDFLLVMTKNLIKA